MIGESGDNQRPDIDHHPLLEPARVHPAVRPRTVAHTRPPWELIVVDNGSTDGTGDYLAGLQDASPVPVTVIANGTNRGFPAAINQGLHEARGEYLVLLNNDVVVTDDWLEQLMVADLVQTPRCTSRSSRR